MFMRYYVLLLLLFVNLASCCCARDEVPVTICLQYQCFIDYEACRIEVKKVDPNYKVELVINQKVDRSYTDIQQAENVEENKKMIISCFDQFIKKDPGITDKYISYDGVYLGSSYESVSHSQLPETQKD